MQGGNGEVLELLVNGVSALIALEYMDHGFEKKYSGGKRWLSFISGCITYFAVVTYMNYSHDFEGILGLSYGIVLLLYGMAALRGSVLEKLVISLLWVVIAIISSYLIFGVMGLMTGQGLGELLTKTSDLKTYFIFVGLAIKFSMGRIILTICEKKRSGGSKREEWAMAGSFMIVFLLILGMFRLDLGGLNQIGQSYLSLFLLGGFCIVILLLQYFHRKLEISNQRVQQMQFEKKTEENQQEHLKSIWNMSREMNHVRHDIKGKIDVLYLLVKNGKSQEALSYIESMAEEIGSYPSLPEETGNDGLNAALMKTMQECHEKKIDFRYLICGTIKDMDSMDMGILFYNLFSNAVEACERCRDRPYIDLQIWEKQEWLHCILENSIAGSVLEKNAELKTEKKDKNYHGFGMKSINQIIGKYNGDYKYLEEGELFIQEIWIQQTIKNKKAGVLTLGVKSPTERV